MEIYQSGEDYLEVILSLKKLKGNVRAVDIVEERKFSKSSVSKAVNLLKNGGFILISDNGNIEFTQMGLARAEEITQRHDVLSLFLIKLGVTKSVAEQDACKLEHDMSKETFAAIKKLAEGYIE